MSWNSEPPAALSIKKNYIFMKQALFKKQQRGEMQIYKIIVF